MQLNSLLANEGMAHQSWKIGCVYKTPFRKFSHILFKLKAYDISGNVLNWIMDFLSNSRQGVNVNGSFSDRSNNILLVKKVT